MICKNCTPLNRSDIRNQRWINLRNFVSGVDEEADDLFPYPYIAFLAPVSYTHLTLPTILRV